MSTSGSPQPTPPHSSQPGAVPDGDAPEATASNTALGPTAGVGAEDAKVAEFQSRIRIPMLIALGLAIILVVGVLIGSKVVYERAAHQPVSLSPVFAPDAESAECRELLTRLPDSVAGARLTPVADPAPAGAAVWTRSSTDHISLRCGVAIPAQYTRASLTTTVDGVVWLSVRDETPGSDLASWYSVNTQPVVAVTATADDEPIEDVSSAVGGLPREERAAAEVPLMQLADNPEVPAGQSLAECAPLLRALPAELGEYRRADAVALRDMGVDDSKVAVAVYRAAGWEPVVVRCGVEFPREYEAGARLDEVNGVAWLTSTTLANGTTAGTYFALGYQSVVALSTPRSVGGTSITVVSDAVAKNLPADPASQASTSSLTS